jgi:sugar phosphate isomerase/epimerase
VRPLALGTWALRRPDALGERARWSAVLAWCARAGFRWIELRDEGDGDLPSREMLADHGLAVATLEMSDRVPWSAEAIARAGALGAPCFVHAPRAHAGASWIEELRRAHELARAQGLRSLWKPCREARPQGLGEARALFATLHELGVELLWDTWEAHRAGLAPELAATQIGCVRFGDGDDDRRAALGAGSVDLRAQLAVLHEPLRGMPCWGVDVEGCARAEREAKKATGFLRELARSLRDA